MQSGSLFLILTTVPSGSARCSNLWTKTNAKNKLLLNKLIKSVEPLARACDHPAYLPTYLSIYLPTYFLSSSLLYLFTSFLPTYLPTYFLSLFRLYFFLPKLLPPGKVCLPPYPTLNPPLSPKKVCWVCGDSVAFLSYLVGAEEEEGVKNVIKINGKLSKIQKWGC